ncbi:hypothetical protein GF324_07555 [bacterium]|nr:hypothetical protein [bacterium]
MAGEGREVRLLVHDSETDLIEAFRPLEAIAGIALEQTETLHDLIGAVRGCELFIGNDSGPMHLANIYGKRTIILWGPGNYERIRPLGTNNTILIKPISCRPCKQYIHPDRCERGINECLLRIAVKEVTGVVARSEQ